MASEDDHAGEVWVTSEVQPDGSYAVTIAFTPDEAVTLTDDQALQYAMAVLGAAQIAEYDAAILRQLKSIGMSEAAGAEFIADYVRPLRNAVMKTGTALEVVPGISHRTKEAFLLIKLHEQEVGQWTFDDARDHAMGVLDSIIIARLDAKYHASLHEHLKLDDLKARGIVGDIINHRQNR